MNLPSSSQELARVIEHSCLRPETTDSQILKLCEEAREFGFYAVVVNSNKTVAAVEGTKRSDVKVVTTVSFPFGSSRLEAKVEEMKLAIGDGAHEVDVVADLGMLAQGRYDAVGREVSTLSGVAKDSGVKLKVIVETSLLSGEGIAEAAKAVERGGADFVKTNTGFGSRGVSVEDVEIISRSVRKATGIKAAGGIGSAEEALQLIRAGATRIGTSKGPQIMNSFKAGASR